MTCSRHRSSRRCPAACCLETGGRLDAQGRLLELLTDDALAMLCEQVALAPQAVAVNLLFSYLDPSTEERIAAALPDDLFVSLSSRVLPEIREYMSVAWRPAECLGRAEGARLPAAPGAWTSRCVGVGDAELG